MYDSRNRRVWVKKNNGNWRWDIYDGNVCIAQVENGIMKKFFVRGMGIAEGTGDVVAEVDGDDLQFTNYNVQFGAEGRQDAGYRMQDAGYRMQDAGFRMQDGKVAGASRPLVDTNTTRNRAGSSTMEAASCRLNAEGTSRAAGLATLHLFIYDSMGNVRNKVRVREGSPIVTATYEYDPYGRLLYAEPPPARETAPQFLFSTKLYESHWQQYYYGYNAPGNSIQWIR